MTVPAKSAAQLITDHQGLVRSLAKRISRGLPSYVDQDDLVSYGQLGLAEAAQSFDPGRGHQFSTFAYYRIRGAIYDGLAKMSWFNRSQYEHSRGQQLAGEVLAVEADGTPEPTDSLREEVRWLKRATASLGLVFLMTQGDDEQQSAAASVVDEKADPAPAVIARRELHEKLHAIVDTLPEESATLIRAVYFEGLTIQEAGQRIGVSKAWASRLHARTLEQLARTLRRGGVADAE